MKTTTIGRRLNTAQLIMIGMLLAGVGLAFWGERASSIADKNYAKLASGADRIRIDLIQMSDALRGQLLNPKDDLHPTRRVSAENDLTTTIDQLEMEFAARPAIVTTLKNFNSFSHDLIKTFHLTVLQMLERDPAAAVGYYNQNFSPIRDRRDSLLKGLDLQIRAFESDESIRAQNIAIVCLTFAGMLVIATLILGRFQSTAVSEPLGRLVDALERMRRGDFTQRVKLEQQDEFGVLGEGLNRLAGDLSVLVGQVQHSGIQVNTTMTEIAATAKEQQSTANQIAATTAEIGATSKEISATSKELDRTMNEVSQVAEDTAQLANTGQNAIGRMESTMRQITEAARDIAAKLAVLSEKTANINSVVTAITRVADQTNLLSLNAAIEAEKAGEYGLGFAVVAMEIRRLADQTAVATYDIEKMVKEMQSAVAAGVMGMDKFSEEARRGVEEIRQVSTQLAQIIHQVQTLTPRFQTVNEGMHAQATGAQQISETLTQLSEAAQQTAESLRQSNLAIEQLNEAARGLQTSVSRFKLEVS
jgi:methyl-accepting chemotaxis protein WspA